MAKSKEVTEQVEQEKQSPIDNVTLLQGIKELTLVVKDQSLKIEALQESIKNFKLNFQQSMLARG